MKEDTEINGEHGYYSREGDISMTYGDRYKKKKVQGGNKRKKKRSFLDC